MLNLLEHKNDSPPAVARRELRRALYGPASVYARTPTPEAVASLSRADMRAFVEAWERPDGAVLGLSGDFEPGEMIQVGGGEWQVAGGGCKGRRGGRGRWQVACVAVVCWGWVCECV